MNRRLRLAHVTATFPPYRGGTGSVVWHQTRELARLGHEVHVFTAHVAGPAVAPERVTVQRLRPLLRIGNAPLLPGLVSALRGYELVHLHYPFFFGAEAVWVGARRYGVPYVVTYHNDVVFPGVLSPLPRAHFHLFGRHILRSARRVQFTTLDYARTSLAAEFAMRPDVDVLPLGVDVDRFRPDRTGEAVRRALDIDSARTVILFVGGLDRAHYFKGLDVLLRALARSACAGLDLIVVGGGDLRARYEHLAAGLGLARRVTFAGHVSEEALPAHYAAADVVVLPSVTRGEAFGVVLLEAMASARAVVASDLPGVRVVVGEAGAGLLVPAGDADSLALALAGLAAEPEKRRVLGMKGRRAVEERHTWPGLAVRLQTLYRDVLGPNWQPGHRVTDRSERASGRAAPERDHLRAG